MPQPGYYTDITSDLRRVVADVIFPAKITTYQDPKVLNI